MDVLKLDLTMKSKVYLLPIALALLFLTSCDYFRREKVPLDEIDVNVEILRFDKDLFSINTDSVEVGIERVHNKYGNFFTLFTDGIIGIGTPDDDKFGDYLTSFIEDKMVTETYQMVQSIFENTQDLNRELTNAFKRYKYYFPNRQVPAVYGFVSGFNNSVIIADSVLAVGFDRYLGRDCEYYTLLGIHKYLQYNMHPKKITSDLIRSWGFGEFQFNDSIDNLLNNMIYEGALMYFTKQLLPKQSDSLIFGYTSKQMKWCKRNEKEMWTYLVEHKLLFNTDDFTVNQYVSDAPFTPNFTKESPGKTAVWLGYRIVSKFMESNPDYTLELLMEETDYQKIMNRARYNP